MTDKKFTQEQIIKALECCSNDEIISCGDVDCPLHGYCMTDTSLLEKLALDLINYLTTTNKNHEATIKRADELIDTLKAEIEELRADNNYLFETMPHMKAEAIKEFAERLSAIICDKIEQSMNNPDGDNYFITDVYTTIEDLAKEMTEEK